MEQISKDAERLEKLLERSYNAATRKSIRDHKRRAEEYYFSDVEETLTQYTRKQKKSIKDSFNIPVSTKITHAIISHTISFLTATKPFPRYIAAEQSTQEFVIAFQKLFHAMWYESDGKRQLVNAVRDMLTTGTGNIRIRKSHFFNEATTNVVLEYVPWDHIFVDPECRDVYNYKDAEYVILIDVLPKKKAERIYDIEISKDEDNSVIDMSELANYYSGLETSENNRYVYKKEFFEKEEIPVYVSENGDITTKKPEPTEVKNEKKAQLKKQIEQLSAILESKQADLQSKYPDGTKAPMDKDISEALSDSPDLLSQEQQAGQEIEQEVEELSVELGRMKRMYAKMPAKITKYKFSPEPSDEDKTIMVDSVSKEIRHRVRRTLKIGDHIVEREIEPCDEYPIANFIFSEKSDPNKVYGMAHYLIDIEKAMNKYISLIMYDIALNGHRKGFIWEDTVIDTTQLENQWAKPGALVQIRPNPQLPDGGKPIIIEPSPINQSVTYMLEFFKMMEEYVSGIHGIMQGDSSQAPSTMGATSSIQNFGAQRVKMYSRQMETGLEHLAYIAAHYIQAYAPRDTVIQYFDDNGDGQEVEVMDVHEDFRIKVRVDITSTLPTTRQMTSQLLTFIAQTMQDDRMKAHLTEYALKILDVPEAKEIAEKIDMVQQLQQQLQQVQQQNEELNGQLKSARNNMVQKEMASKVEQEAARADKDIAVKKAKLESEIDEPSEMEEFQIDEEYM